MLIQRKHPLFLAHPVCVATDYIAGKMPPKNQKKLFGTWKLIFVGLCLAEQFEHS